MDYKSAHLLQGELHAILIIIFQQTIASWLVFRYVTELHNAMRLLILYPFKLLLDVYFLLLLHFSSVLVGVT